MDAYESLAHEGTVRTPSRGGSWCCSPSGWLRISAGQAGHSR
ncbi:hypothetical protein [Streptomyces sp. KL116D]